METCDLGSDPDRQQLEERRKDAKATTTRDDERLEQQQLPLLERG
jgi:hypothetical protein